MFAAQAGHLEIVKVLLNSGANIHAMGKGSTALSIAVWADQREIVESLWPLASDEERQYANLWRKDLLERDASAHPQPNASLDQTDETGG
jgi:ankyrin repeat protein